MADAISVEITGLDILTKSLLNPIAYERAVPLALNATATDYRKRSIKAATKVYNIKPQRIKKQSGVDTTWIARAGRGSHSAEIYFRNKRPGLQWFAKGKKNLKRGKGSPVFRTRRSQSFKPLDRGFFQEVKGGAGMWYREGGKRNPIKRATGPSIQEMYENEEVRIPLEKILPGILERNMVEKLTFQIKRLGGGR